MKPTLPEAVQRQADQVDAMDAEIVQTTAAPPEPEPETPPEAPPTPDPAPQPDAPDWQQKYRTLQGMFNAQSTELRTLKEELENLKATVATPPAPQPEHEAAPKLVTEQDVETFGQDLIDLVRRVLSESAGPGNSELKAKVEALQTALDGTSKKADQAHTAVVTNRRETYYADLARSVPDYATIDVEPEWESWLEKHDPLSGLVRQDLLNKAFTDFDAERTATIFKAYLVEKGRSGPAPTPQPTDPPPAPAPDPKDGLDAQVSPARGGSPTQIPSDTGTHVWTAAEMQEFYTARSRGDFRGREAEANAIEAQIDKALIEQRVRG